MRGLGRLAALPWLMIALAVQALAPAQAAAMQPVASPYGICSAHELGGAHRSAPAKGHDHDCCAYAFALAGLAAAPPAPIMAVRMAFVAPADLAPSATRSVANPAAVERPRSRGPPSPILTI